MNKPLLPTHQQKRISLRETALALLALGCAAGWLNERNYNHSSEEVQEFAEGLRQLRRDPDAVVEVVVYKGDFPVACRMRRFELASPPAKASSDAPAEVKDAHGEPEVAAPAARPREPAKQPKEPAAQESP